MKDEIKNFIVCAGLVALVFSGCTRREPSKFEKAEKLRSSLVDSLLNDMEKQQNITAEQAKAVRKAFINVSNKTIKKHKGDKDIEDRLKCDALCCHKGVFVDNGKQLEYISFAAEYNSKNGICACGGGQFLGKTHKTDPNENIKNACDNLCVQFNKNAVADYETAVKQHQCKCIEKAIQNVK